MGFFLFSLLCLDTWVDQNIQKLEITAPKAVSCKGTQRVLDNSNEETWNHLEIVSIWKSVFLKRKIKDLISPQSFKGFGYCIMPSRMWQQIFVELPHSKTKCNSYFIIKSLKYFEYDWLMTASEKMKEKKNWISFTFRWIELCPG